MVGSNAAIRRADKDDFAAKTNTAPPMETTMRMTVVHKKVSANDVSIGCD